MWFSIVWNRNTSQPDMNDRDIPSVPVTTLAGLASVSDCKCRAFTLFSYIIELNWYLLNFVYSFSAKWTSNIRIIGRITGKKIIALSSARGWRSKSFAINKRWCIDTAIDCSTRTNQCGSYVSVQFVVKPTSLHPKILMLGVSCLGFQWTKAAICGPIIQRDKYEWAAAFAAGNTPIKTECLQNGRPAISTSKTT